MFSRVRSALSFVEGQAGGILLLISVLLIVFQILLRVLVGFGISGVYELATFCVIWSVMLTAGLGISRNLHVRVDVVVRLMPPRVAFLMEIAVCVILGMIGVALIYSGWLLVQESITFGDSTLGTIRIPMWIPQSIMPLGGVLVLFHAARRLIGVLRGEVAVIDDPGIIPTT